MLKRILVLLFICALNVTAGASAADSSNREFQSFLKDLKKRFAAYGWTDLNPEAIHWEYHRTTNGGRPLFFADFGNNSQNCTLLIAAVHGDELPSAYVLFKLADQLRQNPELYRGRHLVVAPLINPDGFFATPPTRVNLKGIDLNRNFPTRDWKKTAVKYWQATANGIKRYYPGQKPGSENETRFQMALIQRYKPQKILSLHSPLNFYDYDGPSVGLNDFEKWLEKISRETNHPLKKLGVYPGSLGNYAGMEKDIFVVTLELPSSDPRMGDRYYEQFKSALSKFMALGIAARKPVAGSDLSISEVLPTRGK